MRLRSERNQPSRREGYRPPAWFVTKRRTMTTEQDEYMALVRRHGALMDELTVVRRAMAKVSPLPKDEYRIALRPDVDGEDPLNPRTLMDDIVVRDVAMFRAEQMDVHSWWVCCYLNNDSQDRICWAVEASARPKRINWWTTEYPEEPVVYEHEVEARGVAG